MGHSGMSGTPTRVEATGSLHEEWRALLGFLRRPRLPEQPTGATRAALASVARLYAIDLALMVLLTVGVVIAIAAGFEMPSNLLDDIELSPGWIAVIVLGAPIAEELIFRLGLSGKAGHLLATLACIVAIVAVLPFALLQWQEDPLFTVGAILAVLLVLLALAWWARGQRPMRWFARFFPAIFWLVAFLFGAIHLLNYEAAALLMLPLVLPQFVMGLLLGYTRVRHGLWSAILLHAMHNGTATGVMLVGQALGFQV